MLPMYGIFTTLLSGLIEKRKACLSSAHLLSDVIFTWVYTPKIRPFVALMMVIVGPLLSTNLWNLGTSLPLSDALKINLY